MALVALSATLNPGKQVTSIFKSLGLFGDTFHIVWLSNECKNTHMIVQPLEDSLSGNSFPQLLEYIQPGRKTIIHCHTLDQVYRVFCYLFTMLPVTCDRLRAIRMYHSIFPDAYNLETIDHIDSDPYLWIIIATIAFANRINSKCLLDSISLGIWDTMSRLLQEKGRVGWLLHLISRGIVLVQKTAFATAKKLLIGRIFLGLNKLLICIEIDKDPNARETMEPTKARFLVAADEGGCVIIPICKDYQCPPTNITCLPCAEAGQLRCSSCL